MASSYKHRVLEFAMADFKRRACNGGLRLVAIARSAPQAHRAPPLLPLHRLQRSQLET